MSRSIRLLRLLQALRGRRHPVTAAELARELEVSERTIYRDVAELAQQLRADGLHAAAPALVGTGAAAAAQMQQQQHMLQTFIAVHGGTAGVTLGGPAAGSLTAAVTGVGNSVLSAAAEAAQQAAQRGAGGATMASGRGAARRLPSRWPRIF